MADAWLDGILQKYTIVVFGSPHCPYTLKAIDEIREMNEHYAMYDITKFRKEFKDAVYRATKMKTVPQIFINGVLIGGYDDLVTL